MIIDNKRLISVFQSSNTLFNIEDIRFVLLSSMFTITEN